MPAARLDLTAKQGRTFTLSIADVMDEAGNLIDFTGASAAMTVRDAYGGTALMTLTSAADGGITLASGSIEIADPDDQLSGVTVPDDGGVPPTLRAVYDLKITWADGTTEDPIEGLFLIERQVTA
jgi:hypothetical protein